MISSPSQRKVRVPSVVLRGGRSGLLAAAVLLAAGCDSTGHTTRQISLQLESLGDLAPPAGIELLDPADLDIVDGRLYIADNGSSALYEFVPGAAAARVLGREGEGPLEFRQLAGISAFSRGVAITDSRNGRITVLDTAGTVENELSGQSTLGAVLVDRSGRMHVARTHAVGEGGTIEVLARDGTVLGTYGKYEPRTHAVANNLHNLAALARGRDGDTWLLYPYRGMVQRYSNAFALLGEWHIPLPDDFDNDAPYVKEVKTSVGMAVAIVRRPVATDITVDTQGHVLIPVDRTEDGVQASDVLAFDPDGTLIARTELPLYADRIVSYGDTLLVLDRGHEDEPRIARFVVQWTEEGAR